MLRVPGQKEKFRLLLFRIHRDSPKEITVSGIYVLTFTPFSVMLFLTNASVA